MREHSPPRVVAIDVLRGMTVAAMLLVNDPGDPEHVYSQLRHSDWHSCTFADFVFPFFLFLVGVTTYLSFSRREAAGASNSEIWRAILRRSAIIFGLGLLLNAYPFFEKSAIAGPEWLPRAVGHVLARLETLRITGVLQRIGLAYFAAALITWKASARRVAVVAGVLLVGYWALLTLVPVPGEGALGAQLMNAPGRTLAAWVDRTMLDWRSWGMGWHLWDQAVPFDPEGLLSTLPAIATVLLGVLAGRWIASPRTMTERARLLGGAGVIGIIGGLVWSTVFPINKPLWTSSYVVFTAGAACVTIAAIIWLVDVKQRKAWSTPFLVFGTNPIVAYVGSELLASVLRSSIKWRVDGRLIGTGTAVARQLTSIGVEPMLASLIWSVTFVVLCYALLRPMFVRGVYVRI